MLLSIYLFIFFQGETLEHILETSLEVAEGVPTTTAALKLLKKHNLELPIMMTVASVLHAEVCCFLLLFVVEIVEKT